MNRRAASALLAALLTPAAAAADWTFNPVLTLQYERNDRSFYIGGVAAPDDSSLLAAAELSLSCDTPRSEVQLLWAPSYERYSGPDEVDHVDHFVQLGWGFDASARASWNADLSWTRWRRPRLDFENPAPAQIAVPAATATIVAAGLGGEFTSSPKTRWGFRTEFNSASYEATTQAPPEAPAPAGDATFVDVRLSWQRQVSQANGLGFGYSGRRIDENELGVWDVHEIFGNWEHGAPGRLQLTLDLGAAKTFVADEPASGTAEEQTSFVANVQLTGPVSMRSRLTAGARHDYTGSNGVEGAVLDTTLYAAWDLSIASYSGLRLLGRVSWLDPLVAAPDLATTRTTGLRVEGVLAFGPRWSAVVSVEAIDQSSDAADSSLEGSYSIFAVGMRWSPMMRAAVTRR